MCNLKKKHTNFYRYILLVKNRADSKSGRGKTKYAYAYAKYLTSLFYYLGFKRIVQENVSTICIHVFYIGLIRYFGQFKNENRSLRAERYYYVSYFAFFTDNG